ncbi:scaffolding protein [Paenibacillus sp. SI8]|uniref:phage scaffolding protein n=1 Tax=unclassified Paenibacillus TaxID=185978 RepID=UPI0034666E60
MKRFIDAINDRLTPMYNADGGGGGNDDGNGEGDDAGKRMVTMTQADLDALIAREKARAKKPFADYDDIKAERERLKQAEAERSKAELSEKERLEAEKKEAVDKAQAAEEAREKALTTANQRLIKSEFRALARESGIRPDALDDAFKLADTSAVSVDDDGNVVGVKDVIEALVKDKPYLAEVKKEPTPKKIGEGTNHADDKTQKTAEQLLADAADKARKSGRIEDQVTYAALKRELSQ